MLNRLIATMRGRRYGLRSSDIRERPFEITVGGETREIFHSAFNTNWLTELNITAKTIIDLGSFDGGDAYRFKKTFPGARVITVEADPVRFEIAKENLAGLDVEIVNYAACSTDGDIDWYAAMIDGQPNAQGSIFRHTDAFQKKFSGIEQAKVPSKVRGRRFDTIAKELNISEIDLLHMDIEGAEHNVLQTLGNLRPKLIFMEWRVGAFQGNDQGPESEALLRSMNYKLIVKKTNDRLYYLPDR